MHITNHAIGFRVATVLGLCAVAPVSAAPVLSNTAALKSAADNSVTEVRYGIRRGVARAAVATGVGLAVAGAARSYGYGYGYPYSYGYQSYNYGYPSSYGYAGYSTSYAPSATTTATAVTATITGTRRDTTDMVVPAALPAGWRDAHTIAERCRA
jgi:hypothetical protein